MHKHYWNQKFYLFLKIYLISSFVLILYLMNTNKNQSNLLKTCPHICVNPYLEYKRQLSKRLALRSICDPTKFKEAIKHLRRSHSTAQEVFNYMTITLNKTKFINKRLKKTILSEINDRKNVIQLQLQNISETLGLETYKTQRLESISKRILSKITKLQNPPKNDCHKVSKLFCRLTIGAGFASGIHEVLWCLMSAYYNNQTVILIVDWNFYFGSFHDVGMGLEQWESVFIPLSTTCNHKMFPKKQHIEETVKMYPNTVNQRKLINQLPREFGPELMALVESPNSWFHSIFTAYIMRPQPRLQKYIEDLKNEYNFKHPIVGIQVRRSDKLEYMEALYYPVSDYMVHVKDFYDRQDLIKKTTERRVYVAADDPHVLPELKRKYPDYIFIGSTFNAQMAFNQSTRYTNSSLWGVLADVFLLSETDYIVCAFSSGICRLSYQLMQFKQKDASLKYHSLDVPFHYDWSLTPVRTTFYNHLPAPKISNQWSLKIGDHLHERVTWENHTDWFDQATNGKGWDSYFFASNSSKEENKSQNQRFYKLYPIYKVYDDIELV